MSKKEKTQEIRNTFEKVNAQLSAPIQITYSPEDLKKLALLAQLNSQKSKAEAVAD